MTGIAKITKEHADGTLEAKELSTPELLKELVHLESELAELREALLWMHSHPHILWAEIIEDYPPILRKMIEQKEQS